MQSKVNPSQSAYPSPLDAVLLAGTDTNPRRLIQGQNKALLDLGGKALVRRVVEALVEASSIGQVFVVGPKPQLVSVLAGLPKEVVVVEQQGQMLPNGWAAIHAAEARYFARHGVHDPDRPMLFISCDLPLISAAAVDDFVSRCAREDQQVEEKYAVLAGVAEENSLKAYYPANGRDGIVRPYVHFNTLRARLANIYVARPRKLAHQDFLQTGFSYRKAKDWHNVVLLAWHFFGQTGGWKAAWLTMRYQATLMASKKGGWLYRRLLRNNDPELVEVVLSRVLGGTVKMVVTPYGGLSLDVDEEEDYRVLSENFDVWKTINPAPDSTAQTDEQ
jgi:GTP:adenosylcobinamide-phosphate guanylyltransferase